MHQRPQSSQGIGSGMIFIRILRSAEVMVVEDLCKLLAFSQGGVLNMMGKGQINTNLLVNFLYIFVYFVYNLKDCVIWPWISFVCERYESKSSPLYKSLSSLWPCVKARSTHWIYHLHEVFSDIVHVYDSNFRDKVRFSSFEMFASDLIWHL